MNRARQVRESACISAKFALINVDGKDVIIFLFVVVCDFVCLFTTLVFCMLFTFILYY